MKKSRWLDSFDGSDLELKLLAFRRAVQPVFQNPYSSLDPRYTIGRVIDEPLRVHKIGDSASRRTAVSELLDKVAILEIKRLRLRAPRLWLLRPHRSTAA